MLKDLDFSIFFQFYGVISRSSKLSITWSFFLTILSIGATFKSPIVVFFNKIKSIYGITHWLTFGFIEITRFFVLISSIAGVKNFEKIFQELRSIDDQLAKFNENTSQRQFFKLAAKNLFFVVLTAIPIGITLMFLNDPDQFSSFVAFVMVSFLQMKGLSFAFFVDLLRIRLEKLLEVAKVHPSREVLKLHTKLFLLSRLVDESHRKIITLVTLQNCYSLMYHIFSIFFHAQTLNIVRLAS